KESGTTFADTEDEDETSALRPPKRFRTNRDGTVPFSEFARTRRPVGMPFDGIPRVNPSPSTLTPEERKRSEEFEDFLDRAGKSRVRPKLEEFRPSIPPGRSSRNNSPAGLPNSKTAPKDARRTQLGDGLNGTPDNDSPTIEQSADDLEHMLEELENNSG